MEDIIKKIIIIFIGVILVASILIGCSGTSSITENNQENSVSAADSDQETDNELNQKLSQLKNNLVSSPIILSHTSGEEIFGSGEKELIFLKGTADPGNTIEVYVNSMLKQSDIIVDSGGNFETLNGIEIMEGENTVELIAINSSGNKSNPTRINLFLDVPDKVEYELYKDSESLEKIDGILYSAEFYPVVYLHGTYLPESDIFIQVNGKLISEVKSDANGIFTKEDIELEQGDNEIAVWAATTEGYVSYPMFSSVSVCKDVLIPNPSSLNGSQKNGSNYLTWTRTTDDNFSSYKLVKVEEPCINPEYPDNDVIATFSNISDCSYVDEDIVKGKSYYYTLWTLDKAGHAISSNVFAIPKPVYGISIEKVPPFRSNIIGRREWYYQYYELTNTGNTIMDIQPMMVWLKLDPEPDEKMEIAPLWEVHIWDPENPEQYYFSEESIFSTHIADWVNTKGTTTITENVEYGTDELTKIVTVTKTTRKTKKGEINLKRIMTITTETTITTTDLTTGEETVETTSDSSTEIVEPEKIGSIIEGLEPGEKIKICVKIQNISADENEELTAHFHFTAVDCEGHFFIDEYVSTLDIVVISSGRN